MKIFVHAASLVIKGKPSEVMQALREISSSNPSLTLEDYLKDRLS